MSQPQNKVRILPPKCSKITKSQYTAMSLQDLFLESEVISALFLIVNLVGLVFVFFTIHSWLFLCIYIIIVFLITRYLAAGRSYTPTKTLRGQTVVITGAASGIGRVCALRFAQLGARVIIGVRGQQRAERIAAELAQQAPTGSVIGYDLDVSSLHNVKNFANKIDRIDILLNNAGTTESSFQLTVDGIESVFATNHLGHFYLTQLLLPLLKNSRVVNVSSLAHQLVTPSHIDYSFSKLKQNFVSMQAYSLSKLAQIYHASELTRRYGIKAYSLHPGLIVDTNLLQRNNFLRRLRFKSFMFLSKSVEQGAMTSLYCALSDDDAQPGHFHSNCQVKKPSALALDRRRAEECWIENEKLINSKIN